MPAYNEEANIQEVVSQWHSIVMRLREEGVDAQLAVANDGSKDNTSEILHRIKINYPCLVPLDKANSGHGATLLYLYEYALEQGADYIFQTDSDGQTIPEEFFEMWRKRGAADFHIGHRIDRQDGLSRKMVTRVLRFVVYAIFHVWVRDANTPFRLMKADALKETLRFIPKDFFLTNVAISAIAVKEEKEIMWYPVTFRPRQGGVNSLNLKRIFKIGVKSLSELSAINDNLRKR